MKTEILARLIQATDFTTFRDIARKALELRGFRNPTISDGWSDGGRDVRIYETQGITPLRYAVQVTVEQPPWKAKLRTDLKRAKTALNCHSFMFVSSRRIADADFQREVDWARDTEGVSLAKMDGQELAALLDSREHQAWLLQKLDISTDLPPQQPPSIQREAAEAFILFSDDCRNFRSDVTKHTVLVAAQRAGKSTRDDLVRNVSSAMGLSSGTGSVSSAIDSILSAGDLVSDGGMLRVSDAFAAEYTRMRSIVDAEYRLLTADIKSALAKFLPKKADHQAAAKAITDQLGRILNAYRDFQAAAALKELKEDVRTKYVKEIDRVKTILLQEGVPPQSIDACLAELNGIAQGHAVFARLSAGAVFQKIAHVQKSSLVQALGGTGNLAVRYDPTIAIPFICGRLYVPGIEKSRMADTLDSALRAHGASLLIPEPYLEECAAHLVYAANYSEVVRSTPIEDLRFSDNAYVSYFAHLGDAPETFEKFLASFGYQKDIADFPTQRDAAKSRLAALLRRYDVAVEDIWKLRPPSDLKKKTEEDVAYALNTLSEEERPSVLVRHDTDVITAMRFTSSRDTRVQVVATWDRVLHYVCHTDEFNWWALDPASFSDLLSIVMGGAQDSGTLSIDVSLTLPDPQQKAASILWDTIEGIERKKLRDAELLALARKFRDQFLASQRSGNAHRIKREWEDFKRANAAEHKAD